MTATLKDYSHLSKTLIMRSVASTVLIICALFSLQPFSSSVAALFPAEFYLNEANNSLSAVLAQASGYYYDESKSKGCAYTYSHSHPTHLYTFSHSSRSYCILLALNLPHSFLRPVFADRTLMLTPSAYTQSY